ncbi:MAG TPA: PAS domain-containing protein, partial [Ruminiclostridium sp.]|nr:PAS domain-containing protein [Ruminiclostridium sp.]
GKAEVTMCMPYMRERAEYISDKVISFSPNAIVVLDNYLNIMALNDAACKLFNVDDAKEYGGRYIGELTDSSAFEEAVVRRENVLNRKIYLFRYEKYVEQSVIYVKEHNMLFAILHDLTESEKQNEKIKKVKLETVQTADNVIEKQMRVVQEIAMLLGETTAETKVALTKLKNTIMSEEV